jgi:hypothetical protein
MGTILGFADELYAQRSLDRRARLFKLPGGDGE